MSHFLVTFCNQDQPLYRTNLLYLDTDTHQASWIMTGVAHGFTGVAVDEHYLYAVHQGPQPGIVILDKQTLRTVVATPLEQLVDAHSLLVRGQDIFVVSTGTDQVLQFTFDPEKRTVEFAAVVWQPKGTDGTSDTHHINALTELNGDLIVSAFGLKSGDSWKTATNGYAYNITKDVAIDVKAITHPHSLTGHEGALYYCESPTREVKRGNETLLQLDSGYIRGLAVTEDMLAVGSSRGRRVSKSTGLTLNITEGEGEIEAACSVRIFDRHNLELLQEFTYLPQHQEIYEIIAVEPIQLPADRAVGLENLQPAVDLLQQKIAASEIDVNDPRLQLKQHADTIIQKDNYIAELREELSGHDEKVRGIVQQLQQTELTLSEERAEAKVERDTLEKTIERAGRVIQDKDREILQMKQSSFWKLRNRYVALKHKLVFWKR